jgi:hypothetical protein
LDIGAGCGHFGTDRTGRSTDEALRSKVRQGTMAQQD